MIECNQLLVLMEYLKAFVLDGASHEVAIHWVDDEPLFRANDIGKILKIVNVHTSTATFNSTQKVLRTMESLGGTQETLFLTERGLYRLLTQSRKPIARPFQEWVYDVLTEIRKKGKYELELALAAKEEEKQAAIEAALEMKAREQNALLSDNLHNTLVSAFRKKSVVYFGKIRDMDGGKALIKIGSTDEIGTRAAGLEKEFGSIKFFHVIECSFNRKLEKFIQKHPMVVPFVYREPVYEDRRSNGEVFLMTQSEAEKAVSIAKRNIYKFYNESTTDQHIEIQRLQVAYAEAVRPPAEPEKVELKIVIPPPSLPAKFLDERNYTQGRGPKVQRYSADGTLLKTYPGFAEAARDPETGDLFSGSIKRAAQDCSLYNGYRWATLARELPDDHIQTLAPTNESIAPLQKGYVAMLSLDRTRIVEVFCDQKAAAADRQFKGLAAISKAIKCQTKSGGHYFQMWADVPLELREAWLEQNQLPLKRAPANGKGIRQIDRATGEFIKEYSSIGDVIKNFKVGRATLQKAIDNGFQCKGFYWKWATSSEGA